MRSKPISTGIMERSWKNYRVISTGSRSVAVDPSNTWFCTGSLDGSIKIWDLASGRLLKVMLRCHKEQIRGVAISNKNTIFSAGDDKQVQCWDVEQNKLIHSFDGHVSSVYCLALHPTMDLVFSGGRDGVCRVWDIRTKTPVYALRGHQGTVSTVLTHPQLVTASYDSTIKLWDIRYFKTLETLTHHKKSVYAMAQHYSSFASASKDGIIKRYYSSDGIQFLHDMHPRHPTRINAMAINDDGVMATGDDNGRLWFWDWTRGRNFQQAQTTRCIYALTYDVTGTRLITCQSDDTIRMWKQEEIPTMDREYLFDLL